MKRTPLTRKTPLRPSAGPLRRSPLDRGTSTLRRVALKAKPRPPEQWTDPAERTWVIHRDGCIAYRHDPGHRCADTFGNEHGPFDYERLTVDHVHDHPGGTKGKRAPCKGCTPDLPQRAFMTGLCGRLNGGGGSPSKGLREFQRAYLRDLRAKGRL